MDYEFTPEDESLLEDMIRISPSPNDIDKCRRIICSYVEQNIFPEFQTVEAFSDRYSKYYAWHTTKYPDEKYTKAEFKMVSLDKFLEESMFTTEYEVDIKHGSREKYLFGEHISKLSEKHDIFNDEILERLENMYGNEKGIQQRD